MLLIYSGLPGSGKTTQALAWVNEDASHRTRINYDDLRLEMFGPDWKFNRIDEVLMKTEARKRAFIAATEGKDVVIDNTNLTMAARQPWIDLANSLGIGWNQIDIDTPLAECIARDSLRAGKNRVGRAVIERFALFTGWIDWEERPYPREFVLVDMDGTLADCSHRRTTLPNGKMDWGYFFEHVQNDTPILPIIRLTRILQEQGFGIIIVSARPMDQCGLATEEWLRINLGVPYCHLFMRNNSDHRDDTIIKKEILDLLPKHRIAYVLDDRDRVVQMWRENGLTCLQVARGDF